MREKELARCYLDNTVTPLLRPLLVKAAAERPADLPRWLADQGLELFRTTAQSPSEVSKWLTAQMREKAPLRNNPARKIVVKENETALDALRAQHSEEIRLLRNEVAALKQEHRKELVQITKEPSSFSMKIFDLLRRVQTKLQASLTAGDLSDVSSWLDEDSSDIDSWLPKNPDLKDFFSPLCFAARLGQTDLVRLLLDRGSTAIDKQSVVRGTTPLYNAACYAPLETVSLLLDRGNQAIDTRNIDGNTALNSTVFCGRTDVARLLLDRGSKAIDTPNQYTTTPLAQALWYQHQKSDLARLLLDRGADRQGKTDLFIAAALGDTDKVQRMLDQDTSHINTADTSEWNATPLDISVYNGHRSVSELLLARGADRRSMTSVYLASALGDADKVSSLLSEDSSEIDTPSAYVIKATPLYVAAYHGDVAVIQTLLNAGSKAVNATSSEGLTALQIAIVVSVLRSDMAATVQLLLNHGNNNTAKQTKQHAVETWSASGSNAVYDDKGNFISEVDQTLRAYESAFDGHIRNQRGIACVASWPGIYARLFDQILAGGKQGSVSAAVVFLPEKTAHYGKHSSDRCYCEDMYGRTDVEWGCKWFELWRGHVRKAVALGQRLQVYYFEGKKGQGKVASWEACHEDAVRRDSFWPRRRAFLLSLPEAEKVRLSGLSSRLRDDAAGERPGSERGDAEEALFMASLSASDRAYLEGGKGLGNSQKAEVAWLEREGIPYEEVDVRDFADGSITTPSSSSRKMDQRYPQKSRKIHKHQTDSEEIRLLRDEITALRKECKENMEQVQRGHRKELIQITQEPSVFSMKIFDLLRRVQTKQQAKLTAADLSDVSGWLDDDSSDIDSWLPMNPDTKDIYSPLCFAARLGETDLVALLLDRGSKAIDKPSLFRVSTPLFFAAANAPIDAALETVALLLDRGSQAIDTQIIDGNTSIGGAAFFGRTDMVRLLLDRGSKAIDTSNKLEYTPLKHAFLFPNPETLLSLLLDRGADRQGKTDLFFTAARGDTDKVQRMLDQDSSDINTADTSDWNATPLDISVYNGHQSVTELLLARGADRRSMTAVYLASALGDADKVSLLLSEDISEIDTPSAYVVKATPLYVAARNGRVECCRLLLNAGSRAMDTKSSMGPIGLTPLQEALGCSMVLNNMAATVQLLLNHGSAGKQMKEDNIQHWTTNGSNEVYDDKGKLISDVSQSIRAYESAFDGHIRNEQGIACVASWPGLYAGLFDQILTGGRQGSVSAAVVFLPEKTANYGKHSSDRCYCEDMYGRTDVQWGCKWFEIWRGHVRKAAALGQRLQVYYFQGRKGKGKVASWGALREDAVRRDSFWSRRRAFLSSLPESEKVRLSGLSARLRDDAAGERPGSERGDAEEVLFMASLSASDRAYLEGGKGLGNSQKAEVAWLEQEGIAYEEVDVRDFDLV